MTSSSTLHDVSALKFPLMPSPEGFLSVYEHQTHVPFPIQRAFVVHCDKLAQRGFHAHKQCTQLLIALQGSCTVLCDDGKDKKVWTLDKASEGLLIPAGIWASQDYQAGTTLLVLTDRPFEEADYLRTYDSFLDWKGEAHS